MPLLLQQML